MPQICWVRHVECSKVTQDAHEIKADHFRLNADAGMNSLALRKMMPSFCITPAIQGPSNNPSDQNQKPQRTTGLKQRFNPINDAHG
jgi:hypothetical protein